MFAFRWSTQHRATNPALIEAAELCMTHLERTEAQIHSQESTAALVESRGMEALHNGQIKLAVEQLQRSATLWGKLHHPYDQARALNDLGLALSQVGDVAQAQATFDQAHEIIAMLAAQIEDTRLRTSFMNSMMVQEIERGASYATAS